MIARTEELPPGGRTAVAECLVLDIETRPDPRLFDEPEAVEEMRAALQPDLKAVVALAKLEAVTEFAAPANLVDPDKIEAAIARKRDKHADELGAARMRVQSSVDEQFDAMKAKAALHPTLGRIACIGWQSLDAPGLGKGVWVDQDEKTVLQQFANHIGALSKPQLIGGYNVRKFDIPFIIHRCAVHEVELPLWFPAPWQWERIVDPCELMDRRNPGTLDAHLRAMGLPRKTMTGEECLKLPLPELAEYCANDVAVEAELIQRLRRSFTMLRRAER